MTNTTKTNAGRNSCFMHRLSADMRKNWQVYVLALPAVVAIILFRYAPMYGLPCFIWMLVFCYAPMGGLVIAFKDYKLSKGIWGSTWVGLKYFQQFVNSYQFWKLLKNTLTLSLYSIVANFPAPILLALMLNQLRSEKYKKLVQTVTYMPHFISMVVLVGMINVLLSSSSGLYGNLIRLFGVSNPPNLFANKNLFSTLYVFSGVWQNTGWDSIIYLAALTAVSPELHEAAAVDGAGKFKQVIHITIPGIMPTISILLILRIGAMMGVGYEKIILLYNGLTYETADVVSTYVYRKGIIDANFSFSTAVNLFNSVINFLLVVFANKMSAILTENSLW